MSLIDVIGVVREAGLISDITIRQGDCGRMVCGLQIIYFTWIELDRILGQKVGT